MTIDISSSWKPSKCQANKPTTNTLINQNIAIPLESHYTMGDKVIGSESWVTDSIGEKLRNDDDVFAQRNVNNCFAWDSGNSRTDICR